MRGKNFWNNVAKHGLLIGIIMGSSRIVEYGLMLSGSVSMYAILTLEWMVVAILFGVLLYRAASSRMQEIYDEVGFSFMTMLNYSIVVSVFASFIVSAMSYIYINSHIGGYTIFVENLITSVMKVIGEAQIDNSVVDMYKESFERLQSANIVEPTLFDTLASTMSSYIIAGAVVGIIVTLIIKRRTKNIDRDESQC